LQPSSLAYKGTLPRCYSGTTTGHSTSQIETTSLGQTVSNNKLN